MNINNSTKMLHLPNFLIIGAAKAGTSTLYDWLNQHPQIYMSPIKETNFFALVNDDLSYDSRSVVGEYLSECITDIKTYQKQFKGVSNAIAIGEASPMYLYSSEAGNNIHKYIPTVKIIVILRDPIERAYSNFLHHIQHNLETTSSFMVGIEKEKERIQNNWWWGFHYINAGFYYVQLKRYYDRFDANQIKVVLYEDLIQNSLDTLRDILSFLGVDESFVPDMSIQRSKSGIPDNKLLHHILTQRNPIKTIFKPLIPSRLRQRMIIGLKNKNLTKPNLESEVREQLIPIFREDVLQLQSLIKRDLSAWLQ